MNNLKFLDIIKSIKNIKTRLCAGISLLSILISVSTGSMAQNSCSTFMLSDTEHLLVGHNLDGPRWRWNQEPGSIFINKRNTNKRSVSGYELDACPKKHIIEWISKYGSITFNGFGCELPDGGMNEAGLVVNEMGYGYQDYEYNDTLPTMMVTQWIQYLLDNYATVDEVIKNIRTINITHWGLPAPIGGNNWHFFITDKDANLAIIEFNDGVVVIYTDKYARIPVLCNNAYSYDLENIKDFEGFGGKRTIIMNPKILGYWFNQGAKMINAFDSKNTDPIKHSFNILEQMQRPYCQQWSIVYDVKTMRVYFRSYYHQSIKYVDLSAFDFDNSEVKVLPDIHIDHTGDIHDQFVPYTYQLNCDLVDKSLREFLVAFKKLHSIDDKAEQEKYIEERKKIIKIIRSKNLDPNQI